MIVTDSSAVVAALVGEGDVRLIAAERLASDRVAAPHLLDVEVANVFRRLSLVQGILSPEKARSALDDLATLFLTRYPHGGLLPRAWELRHTVRPYDGVYIALAELLGCALVTGDVRLAKAPGIRCDVELLTT